MRFPLSLLLALAAAACGSSKPPASAAAPTGDTPTTGSPATSAPAPGSAAAPSPMPSVVEPPPPAAPLLLTAQGQAGGKPFAPKVVSFTPGQGDLGTVTLRESGEACGALDDGERSLTIYVPWKEGESIDLSGKFDVESGKKKVSLTRTTLGQTRSGGGKASTTPVGGFTPKGTIKVLASPKARGQRGRLMLDLTAGTYSLKGETLVQVCGDAAAGG